MGKSIFILGSGRSGTTILFDILSRHHKLGWFSNWNDKLPLFYQLALFSKIRDWELFSKLYQKSINRQGLFRYFPKPAIEANKLWDILIKKDCSRLTKKDVTIERKIYINKYINKLLRWQGKERFISKNTNHTMRSIFLDEIFDSPLFIHIIRDGRAVVNSLLNVGWLDLQLWWRNDGITPRKWNESGKDLTLLWAKHWKIQVETFLLDQKKLNSNVLTIYYEDLTSKTKETIETILDFCSLKYSKEIDNFLKNNLIENKNYKWKRDLTKKQISIIEKEIGSFLSKLGYSK